MECFKKIKDLLQNPLWKKANIMLVWEIQMQRY